MLNTGSLFKFWPLIAFVFISCGKRGNSATGSSVQNLEIPDGFYKSVSCIAVSDQGTPLNCTLNYELITQVSTLKNFHSICSTISSDFSGHYSWNKTMGSLDRDPTVVSSSYNGTIQEADITSYFSQDDGGSGKITIHFIKLSEMSEVLSFNQNGCQFEIDSVH